MFAAIVTHAVKPGILDGDRSALDRANAAWIEYCASRPGFVEFVTLANRSDRVIAVSLWESEAAFKAAIADPASQAARAGFAGMFAGLTPEFLDVTAYRRR